jgi:hypothetical protein
VRPTTAGFQAEILLGLLESLLLREMFSLCQQNVSLTGENVYFIRENVFLPEGMSTLTRRCLSSKKNVLHPDASLNIRTE